MKASSSKLHIQHATKLSFSKSHPSLLMSTSLSIPCEALRVLAASRLEPSTSWSVLKTDTTVSSDSARTGWLWPPPGRLATRWGTACLPDDTSHDNSNSLLMPSSWINRHYKLYFKPWRTEQEALQISPSKSLLRASMAKLRRAPDMARTTRSLPCASSSVIMGRPFSWRSKARM